MNLINKTRLIKFKCENKKKIGNIWWISSMKKFDFLPRQRNILKNIAILLSNLKNSSKKK